MLFTGDIIDWRYFAGDISSVHRDSDKSEFVTNLRICSLAGFSMKPTNNGTNMR